MKEYTLTLIDSETHQQVTMQISDQMLCDDVGQIVKSMHSTLQYINKRNTPTEVETFIKQFPDGDKLLDAITEQQYIELSELYNAKQRLLKEARTSTKES